MTAIYKKEVRTLLTSIVGFVFMAFLLVVTGIYFTAYNLQIGYPLFAYTLEAVTFVFMIAVPVLTMRVLAEEQKQKTDQLLLTAPVTVTEIVVGKFLALVTIYLIPLIIMAFYPIILSQFGTIFFGETYTAMLGYFLMGVSFLAIGLFVSSITESQIIAAVITFLILMVCYLIEGISSLIPTTAIASFIILVVLAAAAAVAIYMMLRNIIAATVFGVIAEAVLAVLYVIKPSVYGGLFQSILQVFNLPGPFSDYFYSGVLSISGIVYYISVTGVFLFLTVQVIQKRRWS